MSNFLMNLIGIMILLWVVQMVFMRLRGPKSMTDRFAKARAVFHKADEDLLGERLQIAREGRESVSANIYRYDDTERVPLIVVCHGGALIDGDADQTDSFCSRMRTQWGSVIVSINYTKLDTQKPPYQQEEIVDTVKFLVSHAESYHIDPSRIGFLGFSGGAYLQTGAAVLLEDQGIKVKGQIAFYPLMDDSLIQLTDRKLLAAPITIITCDNAEENRRVDTWCEHLNKAEAQYDLKEYPDALQGFVEWANPEFMDNPAFARNLAKLDDDQIDMARACEMYLENTFEQYFKEA